ncbi:MAG: pilus assembly protein [Alphaproteobacteria bacterium]|nr:pilus assembly protein [Alphaproteobacteria bacterium]
MLGKLYRKWARKDDGVTAVEFSLLLAPYMMLTLGIIEMSLMFTSASLLEGATNSAARLIRTGQLQQSASAPEEAFRDALCSYKMAFLDCNDIQIEVQRLDSFGDFASAAAQFDEDGNMVSRGVAPGGSSDRVLVRTAYRYHIMTPIVGSLLTGGSGSKLFMSTIVLQSEPYDFDGAV